MNSVSPTSPETGTTVSVERQLGRELVRLRDGAHAWIRPVIESDELPLRLFLSDLCSEARRLRFFSGAINVAKAAQWATYPATGHCGLLAHDQNGVILGHALYVQMDPERAEVAVELADLHHGCGLGTLLMERLAMLAADRGIKYFEAEVLYENGTMLDVLRKGFDARVIGDAGAEERVEFLTSSWRLARVRFAADATAGR